CSEERRAQLLSGGGAFVPIHLLSSGTVSTRLSVKSLSSPPPPCSSPAVTIRVLGPRPAQSQVEQASRPVGDGVRVEQASRPAGDGVRVEQASRPAGDGDLQVVLFALCSGLPQASRHYQLDPGLIHSRQSNLQERPQVSLLQRTPSSPVVCHATGFYPDRVMVFWKRDDQQLDEHVSGEVLPNHDGTFQVSVDLDLSSVPGEDWGRYRCVFQLDGIEDIVTRLDPSVILSNRVQESSLLQVGVEVLGAEPYRWGGLHGWAVDLMLHHTLSLQNAIQSHDSPPRPFTHKTLRFLTQLQTQMRSYQPLSVGCMDELSVFLDLGATDSSRTLQLFGRIENRWCDVMLSGLADGTFLKPALFVRGPEPRLPHGFPDNVLLEVQPAGFTDQQRLQLWFNKVWQPHLDGRPGSSLLLMDKHRGHEGAEFCTTLGVNSTLSAIIPIGCSAHLQPLDACITPVLREFFQASRGCRWAEHPMGMMAERVELTPRVVQNSAPSWPRCLSISSRLEPGRPSRLTHLVEPELQALLVSEARGLDLQKHVVRETVGEAGLRAPDEQRRLQEGSVRQAAQHNVTPAVLDATEQLQGPAAVRGAEVQEHRELIHTAHREW
ncbi:hypothetical protein CRUP_015748, partial [Coryphaenoides rupestris]